MSKPDHEVHVWARHRCRQLFRCTATAVLVIIGGFAPLSYAEQRLVKAATTSSDVPAYSQAERLDEKTLGAIRGEGGAGVSVSHLPLTLSVILWDEPGSGASKPNALPKNSPGDSTRRVASGNYKSYQNVSISISK